MVVHVAEGDLARAVGENQRRYRIERGLSQEALVSNSATTALTSAVSSEGSASLPQAAGKAGAVLARSFMAAAEWGHGDVIRFRDVLNRVADQRMPLRPGQKLVIRGVVQPEPDPDALARTFLKLLDDQLREQGNGDDTDVNLDAA